MDEQKKQKPSTLPSVICFGEILWDCLPRGLFLGGAPFNVAYHLQQLGSDPLMWSALGNDFLGQEARRRIAGFGLQEEAVFSVNQPTGAVIVSVGESGDASYDILQGVAWDEIPYLSGNFPEGVPLVHGSLALRSASNRESLRKFSEQNGTRRFFDVNLRPPYDDHALIEEWMRGAMILKMNEDELYALSGAGQLSLQKSMQQLLDATEAEAIVVTRGAAGAALLAGGDYLECEGIKVDVKDTVGAGDAFMARLVHGWLQSSGRPDWGGMLDAAVRLGSWVAASEGAQPSYAE